MNPLMVSRNQSLGGKFKQNQNSLWFYSFIHRKSKIFFTWRKEEKLWVIKGVWRASHNEPNLRLHGIRVSPFWNPARISLDESLSGEKISLG